MINTIKSIICGLAVCVGLASSPGVAGAMYKWVDENGQTHYTQSPPPAGVEGTAIAPPPEPSGGDAAGKELRNLKERLDQQSEAREKSEKDAAEDAAYAAEKASRCDAARQRLEKAQRPRTNFIDPDGTQRRASEEERLEQIRQAEKQVKEFCG